MREEEGPTESVRPRAAFIVWLGRDAAGQLEGTVERARTGEKHRFHGLDAIAGLLQRMTEDSEGRGVAPRTESKRDDR